MIIGSGGARDTSPIEVCGAHAIKRQKVLRKKQVAQPRPPCVDGVQLRYEGAPQSGAGKVCGPARERQAPSVRIMGCGRGRQARVSGLRTGGGASRGAVKAGAVRAVHRRGSCVADKPDRLQLGLRTRVG